VANYDLKEIRSTALVKERLASLGWCLRETPIADVGIDAIVEEYEDDEHPTGKLIALQIKCGESSLPVLLVLVSGDFQTIWWQEITDDTVRETQTTWSTKIPLAQQLDRSALPRWREMARASKELEGYVRILEERLSAYKSEVSEFREEFTCPVCGAWRENTYDFVKEGSRGYMCDIDRRVFLCGRIEDNGCVAQPCLEDPNFPLFEDFDIKVSSHQEQLFGVRCSGGGQGCV